MASTTSIEYLMNLYLKALVQLGISGYIQELLHNHVGLINTPIYHSVTMISAVYKYIYPSDDWEGLYKLWTFNILIFKYTRSGKIGFNLTRVSAFLLIF